MTTLERSLNAMNFFRDYVEDSGIEWEVFLADKLNDKGIDYIELRPEIDRFKDRAIVELELLRSSAASKIESLYKTYNDPFTRDFFLKDVRHSLTLTLLKDLILDGWRDASAAERMAINIAVIELVHSGAIAIDKSPDGTVINVRPMNGDPALSDDQLTQKKNAVLDEIWSSLFGDEGEGE